MIRTGDPRTERVRAIRAASRLEIESVRLFDQPPVTPIDLYHRKLRWQPAVIRQVASQTNDDARSVEAQTDEVGVLLSWTGAVSVVLACLVADSILRT